MSRTTYMDEAIRIAAENAATGGGPFGCVVVRDGEIVGRGVNRVTEINDPSAHAEIVAIRDACAHLSDYQLHGCDVYCSCEPCPMCLGAFYWARPARVFYAASREDASANGFDDGFIYEEFALPPEDRTVHLERAEAASALAPFAVWAANEGRREY